MATVLSKVKHQTVQAWFGTKYQCWHLILKMSPNHLDKSATKRDKNATHIAAEDVAQRVAGEHHREMLCGSHCAWNVAGVAWLSVIDE